MTVPIRYTTAVEENVLKFKVPMNEVGGTITVKADAQAIPLDGVPGERLPVAKGVVRPALGVFTIDDLQDAPAYMMLVGTRVAFIRAGSVTFTPNSGTDTAAAIDARDKQWLERLTPPR